MLDLFWIIFFLLCDDQRGIISFVTVDHNHIMQVPILRKLWPNQRSDISGYVWLKNDLRSFNVDPLSPDPCPKTCPELSVINLSRLNNHFKLRFTFFLNLILPSDFALLFRVASTHAWQCLTLLTKVITAHKSVLQLSAHPMISLEIYGCQESPYDQNWPTESHVNPQQRFIACINSTSYDSPTIKIKRDSLAKMKIL